MILGLNSAVYQGRVGQSGTYDSCKASAPLDRWVENFWQLAVETGEFVYRSVPDNCIDFIVNLDDPDESFVVRPFSSPVEFSLLGPVAYFGVRFRALGYQGLVEAPIGEWHCDDNVLDAKKVVGSSVLEQVLEESCQAGTFVERCAGVSRVLERELKYPAVDRRLARFIGYVGSVAENGFESATLDSSQFGVSERQLRRLSQLHLGLPLRDFWKVTRFQRVLHLLNTSNSKNVWAGHYYDQSHYIREFKALSGATPETFVNMSVLYNRQTR